MKSRHGDHEEFYTGQVAQLKLYLLTDRFESRSVHFTPWTRSTINLTKMIKAFGFNPFWPAFRRSVSTSFWGPSIHGFWDSLTLKMEVTHPCETSAAIHQSIRRNILQDQFSKIPLSATLISQPHKKFGIKVSIKLWNVNRLKHSGSYI
jgi:hypothetical protein